jgi:hypothetical protein
METGKISDINPENSSTYKGKFFITIDIDWAEDFVITNTLEILEKYDVSVTWFITHKTKLLDRIVKNSKYEIGIHPNFNKLLERGNVEDTVDLTLSSILDLAPEAKSVRSHSLMTSSKILDKFVEHGLTHESNILLPASHSSIAKPFKIWNSLIRVPIFWEDDIACRSKIDSPGEFSLDTQLNGDGFLVLDFHPIHIFLNTNSISLYERTRKIHRDPHELRKVRNVEYGVKNRFIEVLNRTIKT